MVEEGLFLADKVAVVKSYVLHRNTPHQHGHKLVTHLNSTASCLWLCVHPSALFHDLALVNAAKTSLLRDSIWVITLLLAITREGTASVQQQTHQRVVTFHSILLLNLL